MKREKFYVILLHDVIEHVPAKGEFLLHLKSFLKSTGVLFVGFPAWQMPFGGHQQICRSKLCSHFPFIHLLPNSMYNSLLKLCKEEDGTISELMSIKECRTSIELFEKLIKRCEFSVADKKFWFINPHYKQKFHLTPSLLPRFAWKIKVCKKFLHYFLLVHIEFEQYVKVILSCRVIVYNKEKREISCKFLITFCVY